MRYFKKFLLQVLAVVYLLMTLIGFLGYFEVESFSANIYSFFKALLGSYAVILPVLCLVFTVVCWKIAGSTGQNEDPIDQSRPYSAKKEGQYFSDYVKPHSPDKARPNHPDTGACPAADGFSQYFQEDFPIAVPEEMDEDKYRQIGSNFSTYFGEGEKNIYLPPKTVNLQGFKDYFREKETSKARAYEKAVNDTILRDGDSEPDNQSHFRKPSYLSPKPVSPPSPPTSIFSASVSPNSMSPSSNSLPIPLGAEPEPVSFAGIYLLPEKAAQADKVSVRRWQLPKVDLLKPVNKLNVIKEQHNPSLIEDVLATFAVSAKVVNISMGPLITQYELSPAPGTKISKIVNLADDLSMALASREIRIEAPIPGKAAIGIEIPRLHPETVFFREVIDTDAFLRTKSKLKFTLGKKIAGSPAIAELDKMPHLLVAGATGSGKSIFINCLICSLLYNATPDEARLLLIDPKMVELTQYNGIPHLLAPVVTDPKKANVYLKYIVKEMENRYELFAAGGVRDIENYNATTPGERLPYFVVVIDELADLMLVASNEIEESICRIAQMARAAGIHLILATQRPSVNVITGLIKANIPSRISFAVSSQIDSRTILDSSGAEKLLGKGDMLYSPIGLNKPLRVHGCYIDEEDVKAVIEFWKRQGTGGYAIDSEEIESSLTVTKNQEDYDERFFEAGELVIASGVASVSFLQRRLRVGYSRAARLMDMLEEAGVVAGTEGNKPREILLSLEEFHSSFSR